MDWCRLSGFQYISVVEKANHECSVSAAVNLTISSFHFINLHANSSNFNSNHHMTWLCRVVLYYSSHNHASNSTLQIDFECDNFNWTSRWGSFGDPDGVYKGVEMLRVYEMALRTWSDWLEVHVNRKKTQLFFVSMSPTHERYPHQHNKLSYFFIAHDHIHNHIH